MKIQDLLEFVSTKPTHAYHATKAAHLKSILKQGLIPNKSGGGYASDAESAHGYSLSALPGVYFYRDGREAERLANDLSVDTNSKMVVVICKVQPKTATLDEDGLTVMFDENKLLRDIKRDLKGGKSPESALRDVLDSLLGQLEDKKLDPRLMKNVVSDVQNYVQSLIEFALGRSKETGDAIKKQQEILTNKLRRLLFGNEARTEQNTFKINEPIGFSGANRIVGIYDPDNKAGWGELGYFDRDAYHKYKTPMEMLQKMSA